MLVEWDVTSRERLEPWKNLKDYVIGEQTGAHVLGAINLIRHAEEQSSVLAGEAATRLTVYLNDINSREIFSLYAESVGDNLSELVCQIANAKIRALYGELYIAHKDAIIKNPPKPLNEIVAAKTKTASGARRGVNFANFRKTPRINFSAK